MSNITVISIILLVAIVAAGSASFFTSRKMRRKVAYMLDALEDKELNFRFDEKRLRGRKFNRTLNRLRNIFDKDGRVTYSNTTALNLLGIATFGHIRQLRAVSDSLYAAFHNIADGKEEKASYYNESGKMTISITASEATIGKETIRILAFNDISSEIAENEQQSWSRLIRVLTHEIMNTVTPISSLSATLLNFEGVSNDLKDGLNTISQSSKALIKFVDSYRNLTRVAPPVRKAFYIRELVERVIGLTREQALLNGAVCSYEEKSEDILIYADEGQITQILINLVKNAIQAEARQIIITAHITHSEQTVINVSNDGYPISRESQDEIFVPFFTTKQDGTGIGLSLSRQIMRMHNGTLTLTRSDENSTVFTLLFK